MNITKKLTGLVVLLVLVLSSVAIVHGSNGIDVTPDAPTENDNLTCTASGGSGFYNYFWHRNNSGTASQETTWTQATSDTLDSSLTTAGERWDCNVYDSVSQVFIGSDSVIIASTTPPGVTISPDPALTTDNLMCNAVGGSGFYSYKWFKDGVEQAGLTTDTVDSSLTANGETWTCEARDALSLVQIGTDDITIGGTPGNQPPVADAGPDQTVNVNDVVTFDGSGSSDPDGTIVSYDWDFGDASNATGAIVTHAFTTLGNYTVTLTVTDNNGSTDLDTAFVIANGRPTAVLSCPATGQIGQSLTIDGSQSTDDTTITDYTFDFGDGNTVSGTSSSVTHAYAAVGTYSLTLTITDDDFLTHTDTCSITISTAPANQPPIADAGIDQTVDVGDIVTFDGSGSSDPDGTIVSYLWDFGDGFTAVGAVVTHVFTTLNNFIVTLTVTDNSGATATDTALVIANGRPTAVLSCPVNGEVDQEISFDASQSTDDTQIVSYMFDFGDGATSTKSGPIADHTYDDEGTYTVTLVVTDDDNLTHSTSCSVSIGPRTSGPVPDDLEEGLHLNKVRITTGEIVVPGELARVSVELFNDVGVDLEDVKVTAFVYDLSVRRSAGPFDLDDGDELTTHLFLDIPEDAEAGDYPVRIVISNDDVHRVVHRYITIK